MKWTSSIAAVSLMAGVSAEMERPVTKVVKLLEKMMKTSQADGKKERVMFAKFKCFCDTNNESKTNSIAAGEESAAFLNSEIEELKGSSGKLSMEVAQLKSDMDDNVEARDKAESLREKANKKFLEFEADMEAALSSMGEAISTLAAIGADQTDDATRDRADHDHAMGAGFMSIKKNVKKVGASVKMALAAASSMLSKQDREVVEESLLQMDAAPGVYSSASSEIIGILKNMRDTFSDNLAEARSTEKAAVEAHAKFMATKEEEHSLMDESFTTKQGQLGENDTQLGDKKAELKAVEEQLAEDQEFLGELIALCKEKTELYEDRKATRTMEEEAIAQAVSILSSDDAFATFGKTTAAGGAFLQMSKKSKAMSPRQAVMKQLLLAAKQTKSMRLAKVAVALQAGNAFTKVLGTIDNMIKLIDEEEKADDDKKAWCDDERATNKKSKEEYEAEIESLEAQIDQLISDIEDDYKPKLATANTDLATNKKDQADATAERKEENEFYAEDVKNLVAAQELLDSALTTLKKFYNFLHAKQGAHHYDMQAGTNSKGGGLKKTGITILSSDPDYDAKVEELKKLCSDEPECVGFDTNGWLKSDIGETYQTGTDLYEKVFDEENKATLVQTSDKPVYEGEMMDDEFKGQRDAGVLGMIEGIIADTAKEEEEAHKAEEESLKAYNELMDGLLNDQKTLEDTIETLEANIAKAEVEKANAEQDLKKTTKALDMVVAYLAQIKPGCDFIDDNLELRKKSRKAEKTALEGAIKLLKGTPAFKAAVASAEQEALGDCKDICNEKGRENAACEACLADTSIPGYCAGHAGTPGC